MQSQLKQLLSTQRFLPLFLTQFFGAFNDNVLKNAMVILIIYRLVQGSTTWQQIIVTFAAFIFIFPYFLFSATAGQLSDKYDKATLIRIIKFIEIVLMTFASIGFYLGSKAILLTTLFLMGTQSTFFGPIKYAILPEHLHENELIAGNAFVESSTFIAILLGTIFGGILIIAPHGIFWISFAILAIAILGFIACFWIPHTQPAQPDLAINKNIAQETWNMIGFASQDKQVFLAIIGISWFWLVGALFLAQFPNYAKITLHAQAPIVTLFLTLFSIGIGIGSFICHHLLKGRITATYVPLGIIGMSIFISDLHFASAAASSHDLATTASSQLISLSAFFTYLQHWRIIFDILMISVCGGIYIVPLYAIMQNRAPKAQRSRVVAGNNILNSLFMAMGAILSIILLTLRFTVTQVFLVIAIINSIVAILACRLLPEALIKSFAKWLLTTFYQVKVQGLENYDAAGERMVIIANHTSYLDALLISAYLPDKLTFAINTHVAQKSWMKPFLTLVESFPIDPSNPMTTKSLIKVVNNGNPCVIFPEGRLTVTGALMKIYEGPAMIADKADAVLLPIRIDGAQYTSFTRLRGKVTIHWFPKITLTILPPQRFKPDTSLHGRARRQVMGQQLYDFMATMMFETSDYNKTLFEKLIVAKKTFHRYSNIAEDSHRNPIKYGRFITRCFTLGYYLRRYGKQGEYIGLLLPNMVSSAIVFFALQATGRIPAMLNFSSGTKNIINACETGVIRHVITARKFVNNANLAITIETLEKANIQIHYLEDIKYALNPWHKSLGKIFSLMPQWCYRKLNSSTKLNDPAVLLFTSGSEGIPKGVVLSHKNILTNIYQLGAHVDFSQRDIIFNTLPIFHSFGLTVGLLLPLFSGVKVILYPSPLHYRIIPDLAYDSNATIIFGTDTFLANYGKFANPYDFYSVRYVFAGAEKVKDSTRNLWIEKFGIRILEGYGATETSPVLTTNTPMHYKANTVGRLLPKIDYKIKPVAGIHEGGRLWVKGPNVMLGYIKHDKPGVLQLSTASWYDTGDIITMDNEGYITIQDRAKRFAKIAGEMVSLTAVENYLNKLWPNYQHAVINLPDNKKSEKLLLISDYPDANRNEIVQYIHQNGLSELSIPKEIHIVKEIPLLASGKMDYAMIKNHYGTSKRQKTFRSPGGRGIGGEGDNLLT